ncbi:Bromodomain containing protein [Tritrichomonas foetus]|uniref:Bromodomain containing protein n=1 Tax=Tritrichomonas foetus TaxID=1144522 RepID=A0A1J4KD97_9EUKA|nr:Bromodomain containing protein [Tritrichomonas foetus]|eukprot:OHT07692.1 Bromodomain containing protein [Tritrichomonas foetus]
MISEFKRKRLLRIINDLLRLNISKMFAQPVDPERDQCPDYLQVIKKPMDLGTIRDKVENNEYESAQDFKSDVELVFSNAITYNGRQSVIALMVKHLQMKFREMSEFLTDSDRDDWVNEINEMKNKMVSITGNMPKYIIKERSAALAAPIPAVPVATKTPQKSDRKEVTSNSTSRNKSSKNSRDSSNSGGSTNSKKSGSSSKRSNSRGGNSSNNSKEEKVFTEAEIEKLADDVTTFAQIEENYPKVIEIIKRMEPDIAITEEVEVTNFKLPTLRALKKLVDGEI